MEPNELIEFIKNGLNLYMSSMNDYDRVKAYLEKTKVKFFTFTPKDKDLRIERFKC